MPKAQLFSYQKPRAVWCGNQIRNYRESFVLSIFNVSCFEVITWRFIGSPLIDSNVSR